MTSLLGQFFLEAEKMLGHSTGPGKDLLGWLGERRYLADVGEFILCQHKARYYLDTEMNFSFSVLLKVTSIAPREQSWWAESALGR